MSTATDYRYSSEATIPPITSMIPKKKSYCEKCYMSWCCVLSYVLFGYICADGAILLYLNIPNKTITVSNHTFILDSEVTKQSLVVSEGIALTLFFIFCIYHCIGSCKKI